MCIRDSYYTDIGLRNARLNYRQYDPGHIMENIIYNELLSRGYSVDVGVVTDRTGGANTQKEIDFVVNDADKKIYIQSAFQDVYKRQEPCSAGGEEGRSGGSSSGSQKGGGREGTGGEKGR